MTEYDKQQGKRTSDKNSGGKRKRSLALSCLGTQNLRNNTRTPFYKTVDKAVTKAHFSVTRMPLRVPTETVTMYPITAT